MSGTPLIPSKDALRILRCLAYSPPAAVAGAAGALCGVAAIHYHEVQKVRRAERILETKRKLHSITNGRGSARLASMIEAAERGEDFTINRGRVRKNPTRRRQSALATQQEHNDNQDVRDNGSTTEAQSQSSDVGMAEEQSHYEDDNTSLAMPFLPFWKDVHNSPRSPRPPPDTMASRYNRDLSPWDQRSYAARRRIRVKPHTAVGANQDAVDWQPLNLAASRSQPPTDLNPVTEAFGQFSVNERRHSTLDTPNASSILLDTSASFSFSANPLSILRPWNPSLEDQPEISARAEIQSTPPLDGGPTMLNLYIPVLRNPPAVVMTREFHSRYNLQSQRVRDAFKTIGVERYEFVCKSIMNVLEAYGKSTALVLLESTMERYTATRKPQDFALAQTLYLEFTRIFPVSELNSMSQRFVQRFLGEKKARLEVVSLLYPMCGAGEHGGQQHYYFLAHRYLDAFNGKGDTIERQIKELRKVLRGTQMCDIKLHEHLMIPALRAACSAGQMEQAQALFDEMVSNFKIEATNFSIEVLMKGYAKNGDWLQVKNILDDYYIRGISKAKVYGASSLLISVIDDYAASYPVNVVVNFVIQCLDNYRLQPVSEMTRKIVSLCLRHRSYDLVVKWTNLVRSKYPQIELGTGTSTFAFDISCVWRDLDASAEDILSGCRAISSRTLRDPFSAVFRKTISEAVTRYMIPRLDKLHRLLGDVVPKTADGTLQDFHATLKALKRVTASEQEKSRARLLLSDLLTQGHALRAINALCRGDLRSQGATLHRPSINEHNGESDHVISAPPPALSVLQQNMQEEYLQRHQNGFATDHTYLKAMILQLTQCSREAHAFDLVQSVYDSEWAHAPKGVEFDVGLFTEWLKLALDLRSGSKMRSVLWAILDAGPQLQLNSQIVLLARIAAPKTHVQKAKSARINEVDEVEYLTARLRRRRAVTGPSINESIVFDEWYGFGKWEQ